MNWSVVLILLVLYGIYRLVGYLINSQNIRKQFEEDLLETKRKLVVAERRMAEITEAYKNYKNIDVQTRIRLRTLAEERMEREDLFARPGDLEAAVVKMYERSQTYHR